MTLLIACGLQREARIFARAGVVVVAGGGDAARLATGLEAAIADGGIDAILSSGLAGALDPSLRAGDVVIASAAYHSGESRGSGGRMDATEHRPSSRQPSQPAPGLRRDGAFFDMLRTSLADAHIGPVIGPIIGPIIGQDTILATATQKRALHAQTGALAVDMESHIAARVATRHGLPFAAVRAISDTASDTLPPAALIGMNPDGSMALRAVLASLARQPRQLPALIRTGIGAERAFRALRRVHDALAGA